MTEDRKKAILDIFHQLQPVGNLDVGNVRQAPPPRQYQRPDKPRLVIVDDDDSIEYDSDIYLQAINQPPTNWEKVFIEGAHEIWEVWSYIKSVGEDYYPLPNNVFRAFREISPSEVKVVIIGQDPYHQCYPKGPRATGLAFSQHRWDQVSSSLFNVYKSIKLSLGSDFTIPGHGDISCWCRQGVMLLNTCLTVKPNKPKSHGNIWLGFINRVLRHIIEVNPDVIFVLWGKEAQRLSDIIGDKTTQITSVHPSGLSAYRGFIESDFANKINSRLEELSLKPIDWQIV